MRRYVLTLIMIFSTPMILEATQVGNASWYGRNHEGKIMANGAKFNMDELTAAHKSLPFGTKVLVTNLDNSKTVIVTITDRGPFVKGRIIDLSRAAAKRLDITGVEKVTIEIRREPKNS